MATFNKINDFVLQLGKAVHDLSTHSLRFALTNAANAPVATNKVLADLTQISYTNVLGGANPTLDGETWSESSGTAKLVITDEVITASGGSIAAFRYVVIYNDTPTSPADPLIGWYDYGSDLTLADTQTLTIDFDGTNGVFTVA